jgi:hypothetical protein
MLLQSGATGNVFGYNFSSDPVWVEIPNDAAGELVLHGNYPSYNLFEGNVCENIRPDGSHGANGSFNTFFRNRTTGYGFITTGTQVDFNVLGNEIVPGGFLQGLYIVTGSNHLEYGNNVGGTITPAGTTGTMDTSLYFSGLPSFLNNANFLIGPPKTLNTAVIPAQQRFLGAGVKTDCDARTGLFVSAPVPSNSTVTLGVLPNPFMDFFRINSTISTVVEVYDMTGKRWFRGTVTPPSMAVNAENWPAGIYILRSGDGNGARLLVKI